MTTNKLANDIVVDRSELEVSLEWALAELAWACMISCLATLHIKNI